MDASTSQKTLNNKLNTLIAENLEFGFKPGKSFFWQSQTKTVFYLPIKNYDDFSYLLHETAHAQLEHSQFKSDVNLIEIEVEAWQLAEQIAKRYDFAINTELIEDCLDSYREWLHKRSLCPNCNQNGLQTNQNTYNCFNCRCNWSVNDAMFCRLQRTKLQVLDQP